jgi:hypothetical protein
MNNIDKIQEEIDYLKEYISTDFCKRCEDMVNRLKKCEELLIEHKNNINQE